MKKVIISLLILLFSMSAYAADGPIDQGSMIIEGGGYLQVSGGDRYKIGEDNQLTMLFMPSIGYFVVPGLMIGAQFQLEIFSAGDYSATTIGFGPTLAYFFNMDSDSKKIKGALYPYMKAFFLYSQYSWDYPYGDGTNKLLTIGGQSGFMYMISKSVAADLNVLFKIDTFDDEGDSITESGTVFQIGFGFTAFVWN